MAKLKEDFAAAPMQHKIKYCKFYIEEAADAGKSERNIKDGLLKVGASEELIEEIYSQMREELPGEREKAEKVAEKIMAQNDNKVSIPVIRKILYKLSYMGFDEEIIGEIAEKLGLNGE